jgi:hypothetical protein
MRKQLLVIGVMALMMLVVAPGIAHAVFDPPPSDITCQATVLNSASAEISTGATQPCQEREAGLSAITVQFINGAMRIKALHGETQRPGDRYVAEAGAAEIIVLDKSRVRTVLRLAALRAEANVECDRHTGEVVATGSSETLAVQLPSEASGVLYQASVRDHIHIPTPLGIVHLNHIDRAQFADGGGSILVSAFVFEPTLTPGASIVVGQAFAGWTAHSCA